MTLITILAAIIIVAGGVGLHQLIKGVAKYAIVKPIAKGVKLPFRMFQYTVGYIVNVQFRKELKAINKEGQKIRLIQDMKNEEILNMPSVKKYSLKREHKINKMKLKKQKPTNIDKII